VRLAQARERPLMADVPRVAVDRRALSNPVVKTTVILLKCYRDKALASDMACQRKSRPASICRILREFQVWQANALNTDLIGPNHRGSFKSC
jgi:hypothetical protein